MSRGITYCPTVGRWHFHKISNDNGLRAAELVINNQVNVLLIY